MVRKTWRDKLANKFRIQHGYAKEFMAEFLGTFVLIAFGDGTVAQVVLSREVKGGFITINWCWGLAVLFGIHVSSGISGAHINPAVTLAFATIGRFPWIKVPIYITAQVLGAFLAAGCVYGVYIDAINAFDGGVREVLGETGTAGIFATYPQDYLSIWSGLGDQIFGTALLMLLIMAVIDSRNCSPPKGMEPFIIGLIVTAIGMSFGFNCGYAINPARDFGPRLWTYAVGYGPEVWTPNGMWWWWVPIVGPIVGAISGALIYIAFIELHHAPEDEIAEMVESYGMENFAPKAKKNNHQKVDES